MKAKQLFCRHIYKEISSEKTRKTREPFCSDHDIVTYADFLYYVHHYGCLKCGKTKMEQRRKVVL